MELIDKKCVPCEGDTKSLSRDEVLRFLDEVSGWQVDSQNKKISKEFTFKNFVLSMSFVNDIADLAESEGHHPDIRISYNKVFIELYTHAINGLSENDFILAAKIDTI